MLCKAMVLLKANSSTQYIVVSVISLPAGSCPVTHAQVSALAGGDHVDREKLIHGLTCCVSMETQ